MEDREIIALYFDRSERAISESDGKYGRYCHSIAWNILKNTEDSEECVSDTWLHAWNAIPPEVPKILKAFFGKITRNLSLHRWEKEHAAKRGGGEVPLALDELSECVEDPSVRGWSADGAVLKDVLNRFLAAQSEEKRQIFICRYWYMDPVSDIAGNFGIGESKVKTTLFRMRKALAEELLKEGITG